MLQTVNLAHREILPIMNTRLRYRLEKHGMAHDMSDTQEIIQALLEFRDERDWAQFHNPKDLALALNIEAGELLESFLWKSAEQASPEKIREELADVFAYAFLLADSYGFDVKQIVLEKIRQNALKYPVETANGSAKKYSEL